jgi:hypothetical protein
MGTSTRSYDAGRPQDAIRVAARSVAGLRRAMPPTQRSKFIGLGMLVRPWVLCMAPDGCRIGVIR